MSRLSLSLLTTGRESVLAILTAVKVHMLFAKCNRPNLGPTVVILTGKHWNFFQLDLILHKFVPVPSILLQLEVQDGNG